MFKFSGGDRVKKGYYWNFSTGERMKFEEEGVLPGDKKDVYIRARSGFLLLVIAPFLGLVYAFFLPTAGIVMLAIVTVKKLPDIVMPALERIYDRKPVKRPGVEVASGSEKNT